MSNLLFVSQWRDGWKNLAADEYFLDRVKPDQMILYFYINGNAVIIGRGQNPWAECNLRAMEADQVQLVRRITGGGAVFHDSGNLNFSFIAGEEVYNVDRQMRMILNAVRALGIPCEFTGRNDLLAGGRKFSGNAFCVRGHARQHHGTLLIRADLSRLQNYLNVDPRKLKAKGAKSVRSRVCNLSEYAPDLTCETMLAALKDAYRAEYGDYTGLTEADLDARALSAYIGKQSSDAWRLGRTPRFDVEIENRFAWGSVQVLLTLRGGRVDEASVFSDANDADLPEEIRLLLLGAEFGSEPLSRALMRSEKNEAHEFARFVAEQGL